MKKLKITGHVVIHCTSMEECVLLFELLYDNGYTLSDHTTGLKAATRLWNSCESNTRVHINHEYANGNLHKLMYGSTEEKGELTVDQFLQRYANPNIEELLEDLDKKIRLMEERSMSDA